MLKKNIAKIKLLMILIIVQCTIYYDVTFYMKNTERKIQ